MMYSLLIRLAALTTSAGLLQSSCTGVITTPGGGGGSTPNGVTFKFINASNTALDPQFYTSSQILDDPNTTLFVAENHLTEGFGFAGTGLIPSGQSSGDIVLPCSEVRTVGTLGGAFRNASSGDLLGTGTRRVLSIDYAYVCGETVTITYHAAGGFGNSYTVQ